MNHPLSGRVVFTTLVANRFRLCSNVLRLPFSGRPLLLYHTVGFCQSRRVLSKQSPLPRPGANGTKSRKPGVKVLEDCQETFSKKCLDRGVEQRSMALGAAPAVASAGTPAPAPAGAAGTSGASGAGNIAGSAAPRAGIGAGPHTQAGTGPPAGALGGGHGLGGEGVRVA